MRTRMIFGALSVAMTLALVALLLGRTSARSEVKSSPIQVQMDNFTFEPGIVTVPVNSTVTWVNKDDIPHTVASTDGWFKSKALDTDDKYSYTFTKSGTYSYYCSIHPKMMGKIVVR